MTIAGKGIPGPATFAGGVLDRYRHVCAFVSESGEQDAVIDPFIDEGLRGGERLYCVVDPAHSAVPVNRIRHLGHDAADLLAQQRFVVRTWAETYLRGGGFDQEAMLDLLRQMLVEDQSPRIRMICDMGWAADRPEDAGHLLEFEARANFIHAAHEHVVICSYDTIKFDGSFIIDVLRTHPLVLIGGVLQENPFFIPPDEFLGTR